MVKKRSNIPVSIDFSVFFLRVFSSLFMLTHGYEKFMKIISGDWSFADPIGLGEPSSLFLAVLAEFFCSILLIIGLFTRPALFILGTTMTIIAFIVHKSDPIGDKEHALLFLIIYIAILIIGPGKFSLDNRFFSKK
jgi:putative oxidoreductase